MLDDLKAFSSSLLISEKAYIVSMFSRNKMVHAEISFYDLNLLGNLLARGIVKHFGGTLIFPVENEMA